GRPSRTTERVDTAEYLQGLYYALLEGRFLFDFVHEDDLGTAPLRNYRALLLPNAAYLDDTHCRAIREYVAGGGSLLATFELSCGSARFGRRPRTAHRGAGGGAARTGERADCVFRGRHRSDVLAVRQPGREPSHSERRAVGARRRAPAGHHRRRRHRRDVRV